MPARVLVVLDTSAAWSRGILRGFAGLAHQQGWTLLHYHPNADLEWLANRLVPTVAVLGPNIGPRWPSALEQCVSVAVNHDLSDQGIASVCVDDTRVGQVALEHLVTKGFQNLTTFRFGSCAFAIQREEGFQSAALDARARLVPSWWREETAPLSEIEDPEALTAWLESLPKPCGVFACCDSWGRVVARYAHAAGLRVPEDLALVGVDNDTIECEVVAPPMSSVGVPWRTMGERAAKLVAQGLAGKDISGRREVVAPIDVVARRSSDTLAIGDTLVASAVAWIGTHSRSRVTVPMIARAVSSTRQRLERRFRGVLGRTVAQEVRRTRVEAAKRLLLTTELTLPEVAHQSGFTTASLLSEPFRRAIGRPPGRNRRGMRGLEAGED
jgi:LacI family transcriptional regulator